MSKHGTILRKSILIALMTVLLTAATLPAALPVLAEGSWRGEYYNNRTLSGAPALVRYESAVNFDWGWVGPGDGLPATDFSVRWTGLFEFEGGTYRFTITCDDGARVWVDDALVIDRWYDHPVETFRALHTIGAGYHAGQRRFVVVHAPGKHFLGIFQDKIGIARIICQIIELPRIVFKVEKQRRQGCKVDILIMLVSNDIQRTFLKVDTQFFMT